MAILSVGRDWSSCKVGRTMQHDTFSFLNDREMQVVTPQRTPQLVNDFVSDLKGGLSAWMLEPSDFDAQ